MAGILETLNDRKAYFQELRQNNPKEYVGKMQESTERLARQVGADQKEASNSILTSMKWQARDANGRFRSQTAEERQARQDARNATAAQTKSTKDLGYSLGNEIRDFRVALTKLMEELISEVKHSGGGGGSGGGLLQDLLDLRRNRRGGGGGRRGRGRSKAGEAAATEEGLAEGVAEAESGAARAAGRGAGRGAGAAVGAAEGEASTFGKVMGSIKNVGGKVFSSLEGIAGPALERFGGLSGALGKLGTIGAVAGGGYEAYKALNDDTKTGGEKAQAVANVAGGTAGALALGEAGAAGGAAIGTAIFPGVGTAIGGLLGGVGGGIAGYFGGSKIIDKIGTSISGALSDSGVGDIIGRGAAAVMSPFSEDARKALTSDFENNIVPSMAKTFTPLTDALSSWGDSISDFAKSFGDKATEFGKTALTVAATPVRLAMDAARSVGRAVEKSGPVGAAVVGGARRARDAVASILPDSVSSALGLVSAKYETGGRGVSTISSGKGDHGGVSYGKYQLATNNGSINQFLASEQGRPYAAQFAGLTPGTDAFNQKYQQVVAGDKAGFEDAQQKYIVQTHYTPLANKIASDTGLDVSKRGRGVQEAVMSTAVQYGANTGVISRALAGIDTSKATDADIINAVQNYKAANVATNFRSSSADQQAGVARRIQAERRDLLAVDAHAAAMTAGTVVASSPSGATANKNVSTQVMSPAIPPAGADTGNKFAGVTGSANVVKAAAMASPVQKVSPGTPIEATPVNVLADAAPAQKTTPPATATAGGRSGGGGSNIDLNDIPVFFPDASMALSLLGRV